MKTYNLYIAKNHEDEILGIVAARRKSCALAFFQGKYGIPHNIEEVTQKSMNELGLDVYEIAYTTEVLTRTPSGRSRTVRSVHRR